MTHQKKYFLYLMFGLVLTGVSILGLYYATVIGDNPFLIPGAAPCPPNMDCPPEIDIREQLAFWIPLIGGIVGPAVSVLSLILQWRTSRQNA